jgi:hypothetical protein
MTTREEYAEAAKIFETRRDHIGNRSDELAARVLRALAEGAVLCEVLEEASPVAYIPLDPQP